MVPKVSAYRRDFDETKYFSKSFKYLNVFDKK